MFFNFFINTFFWLFPFLAATVCHVDRSSGVALTERIFSWNLQERIGQGDLEGSCEGRCSEACSDENLCTVDVEQFEPECICNLDHPLIGLVADEKCCEVSGLVVPVDETCCETDADQCIAETFGFQYAFHQALFDEPIPQNEGSIPLPLYEIGSAGIVQEDIPAQIEGTTFGGTSFRIQVSEIIFESEDILQDIQDEDDPFTTEELADLAALNFQATTFFGSVENEELLGFAFSYVDENGDVIGYFLPLEEPTAFGYGNARRHLQAQVPACPFVEAAIALLQCEGDVQQHPGCVRAAETAYGLAVDLAQGDFDTAIQIANGIFDAGQVALLRLKVKRYQKAVIVCTLVGLLATPASGLLCLAREIAIIEGPIFLAKQLLQLALDEAIEIAQNNVVAALSVACDAAEAAVALCLECCDSGAECGSQCCARGEECCAGTCQTTCCDTEADPCCDSDDPCCGSDDPCCESDDPCCDSDDPCCRSDDPCCGSGDVCCGTDNPCCGDRNCDEAGAIGDPHLFTFDGLRYSCQGNGDFVLFRASSGLECHVRFKSKSDLVTLASGVALSAGDGAPTIELTIDADDSLVLLVNGAEVEHLFGYDDEYYRVLTSSIDNSIFVKAAGVTVHADVRLPSSFPHFNVRAVLPPSFKVGNDICGLLGSPDGNASNDWSGSDCEPIPVPTSGSELHNQGGYDYCLASWCIREEESSLFSYSEAFPFSFFTGCDEPYPGTVDITSVTAEVRERCGGDIPCLVDGRELGIEGAQSLLESEARLGSASSLQAAPSTVVVGLSTNVAITVDYSSRLSDIPDGNVSFFVYRVNSETRVVGTISVVELFDNGSGLGGDTVADDGIFSNVLAVRSDVAGESFGFQAVPVIDGAADPASSLVATSLHAVRSYSVDSGIGETTAGETLATITEDAIASLTLVVEYSWPADQPDLDTGTFFLGQGVGFSCGSSAPYITFTGDNTGTGGMETARVLLGNSHADGAWVTSTSIVLNAGWFGCRGQGPASVTVFTEKPGSDGGSVLVGTAVSFVVDPGCQTGCASSLVGQLNVEVDADGSNVKVDVLSVSDMA